MATRTVNLSDEAYHRLAALKREGESFSDVVNRITGKQALKSAFGALSPASARRIATEVRRIRRETSREMDARHRRMWS